MATVRRWSGHEARALRLALRLSIRAFADHLGLAARTVSKWEQHGMATHPRPDTQAILDTALGRADDEAKRRFELMVSDDEIDAPGGTVDDVRRRTLLGLLGPIALGAPLMLRSEPAAHDADDWEQTVNDYAREVGKLPSAQLLPGLVTDFTEIHMRISGASGLIRTRLIHSASQLAALTAIALVNAGEQHAAQRWWRTAARAASETSDPTLTSLVRGRYAVFSLGTASDERVLGLADTAIELGRCKPCVGVISGLAARAQAFAQLGRHVEAATTLHSLTDTYARLPATAINDSAGQWNWSEQRLRHVESHVHTFAGRMNEAYDAQDAALAAYPVTHFQGRTQIELHRTTALIRAGDVDGGTHHLTTVLGRLEPWQRRDGIVHRSAMRTLDVVPSHLRELPKFREARDLVANAAGGA